MLYGRVSKLARSDKARREQHERGEGKSVDQQLAELTARAHREGVKIVGAYRDDGISASRFATGKAREDWPKVMAAITSGEATELWVWEVSRATRDRPVWASLIGACTAQRVLISVGGRVHDPTDPDDGFMLDLGAALAVRESAMTSKRIRRDVAARAAQGLPHGKIPYGYIREYDTRTRALVRQVRDPDTAPIVEKLAHEVLAGRSLYRLADELNDAGVPSPETVRARRNGDEESSWVWTPEQVRDVVLSPAAAGFRVHQGKILEGVKAAWKPIITAHEYPLLKAKLTDPDRRTWTDASAKHLLAGLAVCGECGSKMRRVKNRGCPSYACWGGKGTGCTSRKQEWVDTFVQDVIVERLKRPDLVSVFVRDDADEVERAQLELAASRAELNELRAAKKTGRISLTSFLEFEPDLLAKITDAERRSVPPAVPPVIAEFSGPDAETKWDNSDVSQRREVIRLLATVRIYRATQGARKFDSSLVEVDWHHKLPGDGGHKSAM